MKVPIDGYDPLHNLNRSQEISNMITTASISSSEMFLIFTPFFEHA
jgi:hypothetical protein